MLKFVNEIPVYDFERGAVRFTGLARDGARTCHVTDAALLARAGIAKASAEQLLAIFKRHRQFFEDVAAVLSLREDADPVIDEGHLQESIFASWRADDAADDAAFYPMVFARRLSA